MKKWIKTLIMLLAVFFVLRNLSVKKEFNEEVIEKTPSFSYGILTHHIMPATHQVTFSFIF